MSTTVIRGGSAVTVRVDSSEATQAAEDAEAAVGLVAAAISASQSATAGAVAAASDSVAKTALAVQATSAASAAASDAVTKTALTVTATSAATTATADAVAKTALAVSATSAATAATLDAQNATAAANNAAAQIVPDAGPSLLIKPGTGTFPSVADTYFTGRKSLYSTFDGVRRQLTTFPAVTDFARASTATYFDAAGVLQTAASGVARLGYRLNTTSSTWVLAGLLVEGQATNGITNNIAAGAAVGSPGTAPTGWTKTSVAGISSAIVGSGIANGMEYIDIQWSGTATANAAQSLTFNMVAASIGQTWTGSIYVQLISGTLPISVLNMDEYNTGYLVGTNNPVSTTTDLKRVAVTRTLNNAGTTQVRIIYALNCAVGVTYDYTVRFALPQIEQGTSPSSVIRTTTAQATRAADVFSKALGVEFNPAAQTGLVSFVFDRNPNDGVGGKTLWQWDAGSTANSVRLVVSTIGTLILQPLIGNVVQVSITGPTLVSGTTYKVAFGYSGNMIRLVVNGVAYTDAAEPAMPSALNRRIIGSSVTNAFILPYLPHPTNPLLDATEFPRLLSVAEMQAYTA